MSHLRPLAAPCLAFVLAACGSSPPTATTPTSGSAAAGSVDSKLAAAVAGTLRTDKERARDVYRHPKETLAFFGLKDDMNVVELWPGGGYYTSILAPTLRDRGSLTITHFDPKGDPKSEDTQESLFILGRLDKDPSAFDKVKKQPIAKPDFVLGPPKSADLVLTFRNVHNWIDEGYEAAVFAAIARVLKPGGVLGVEEHRGKPGMTIAQIKDSGYVPEDTVVALAEKAGLKLVARSEINANPKDTTDHPKGVWALPPSYANKDVDRDKYAAIGESDRMTLRFVSP